MFTTNLHLFGILLACQKHHDLIERTNIQVENVRLSLAFGLETLRAVERTSLMSRKARHCLQGFLQVYDSLSTFNFPNPIDSHASCTNAVPEQRLQPSFHRRSGCWHCLVQFGRCPERAAGTDGLREFARQLFLAIHLAVSR